MSSFRHPHSKYWHGVWTIIQLMYIMSTYTSVSLLLCPSLLGNRVSLVIDHDHAYTAITTFVRKEVLTLFIPYRVHACVSVDTFALNYTQSVNIDTLA